MPYPVILARSPARVHDRAQQYTGHRPCWVERAYEGGLYSTEHYRTCSYCGCIHPSDLFELLTASGSSLERTKKRGKLILLTPNPISGQLVRMGSLAVGVFKWDEVPRDLVARLRLETRDPDATAAQRLVGHIEKPCWEIAPELIPQPFYVEHVTEPQLAEIEAAAEGA